MSHQIIVEGKRWIPSLQSRSWIITILWMTVANIWKPFGLFGLVCMCTPILIALSGRGKMHCARVCPRGSFIGKAGSYVNLGLPIPKVFHRKSFRFAVWACMMGGFAVMLVLVIPKGVYALGNAILVFMETATALALLTGILFRPRTWCTICPMGFSTENIRRLTRRFAARKTT